MGLEDARIIDSDWLDPLTLWVEVIRDLKVHPLPSMSWGRVRSVKQGDPIPHPWLLFVSPVSVGSLSPSDFVSPSDFWEYECRVTKDCFHGSVKSPPFRQKESCSLMTLLNYWRVCVLTSPSRWSVVYVINLIDFYLVSEFAFLILAILRLFFYIVI